MNPAEAIVHLGFLDRSRDEDDGDVPGRFVVEEILGCFRAVHVGHHEIHQDHIGLLDLGVADSHSRIGEDRHFVSARFFEVFLHEPADFLVVVDHEHFGSLGHDSSPCYRSSRGCRFFQIHIAPLIRD